MNFGVIIWLTLLITYCRAVVEQALDLQNLDNQIRVSDDITVGWQFVRDVIIFRVAARTKGWVGLGISPNPSMEGADLMLAGVRDGGPYVLDAHSGRNGLPTLDQDQYVDILSGSENETHTTMVLLRQRETFNMEDVSVERGEPYYLLWAFGQTDITGTTFSFRHYHRRNRGYVEFMSSGRSNPEHQTSSPIKVLVDDTTPLKTTEKPLTTTERHAKAIRPTPSTDSKVEVSQINSTDVFGAAGGKNMTLADSGNRDGSKPYKISAAFSFVALVILMVIAKRRLTSLNS